MSSSMPFSLGITADIAAAHRHEFSQPKQKDKEFAPSMFRVSPPVGFSKPQTIPLKKGLATHDVVDPSSSEGEEEECAHSDEDSKIANSRNRPRQRKPSARSKTMFQFAHPVATRHRLKLRLKLLLQLHEVNHSSRPFPKYDVFPADKPTKLICKLPKPYGNTRAFGTRDLVVATSDMYEQQLPGALDDRSVSSEESTHEQREVIATICQSGTDNTTGTSKFEVAFSSGVCWEGIPLANGSYELVSNHGTSASRKVRWVARDKKPIRRSTGPSVSSPTPGASRFTFSVINPNMRQHPVIASMTRKGLTVFNQYSYPTASEQSRPNSPSTVSSTKSSTDRDLINTDEELRTLIVMTGIWVAFMEGWSSRSPLAGEASSSGRIDSQIALRGRSSTHVSADDDAVPEDTPLRSPLPCIPSRLNSLSSKKRVLNRRSTQSELGRDLLEKEGLGSIRRSKSLTAADRRDLKWTSVAPDNADAPDTAAAGHEKAKQDTGHETPETKLKGWHRFAHILRRKKR